MSKLFWYIYRIPLEYVSVVILLGVIICAAAVFVLSRLSLKAAKTVCALAFAVSLFGIAFITLSVRSRSADCEVSLIPFHTFVLARGEKEFYREILMNLLLYVPLGASMPFLLLFSLKNASARKCVGITLAFAFAVSLLTEIIQFAFSLGRAETDDVIFNCAGALAGSLAFAVYLIFGKISGRHKKESAARTAE